MRGSSPSPRSLSIDRLRAAKLQREHYTGIWLPEPVLGESPASPEQLLEHAAVRVELAVINGEWALLRFIDGALESAQSYETDGSRIVSILVQRNPNKLARIAAAFGVG